MIILFSYKETTKEKGKEKDKEKNYEKLTSETPR
jgi:hypothetical protein